MIWYTVAAVATTVAAGAAILCASALNTRAYFRGWDDRGVIHDRDRRFYERRIRDLTDLLHARP